MIKERIIMNKNEINISEIFHTLSGEGDQIGTPTTFVRVFGCNVNKTNKGFCPWCDTMYAVQKTDDTAKIVPIEDVINTILKYSCKDVTFTGGEPLLYCDQITEIMNILSITDHYKFHFETNGMELPNAVRNKMMEFKPTFTISPKFHALEFDSNNTYIKSLQEWSVLSNSIPRRFVSYKFVYENEKTVENIKKLEKLLHGFSGNDVFLMPEGKNFNLDKYLECAKICLDNNWRMSPRLHTILWGTKRGV